MPMRTQTLKLRDEPEPSAEPEVTASSTRSPAELAAATASTAATVEATEPEPRDAPKLEAAAPLVAANSVAEPPKAAPAAAPAPKPQAAAAGDWTVQLGSFEEEANARRLAQRAGTFGHKAEVSSSKNGARTLYRVRVGPQATKAAADATASALRAHGIDARVVAAR
jgi:cell division protein FtsN